jgi:hypothetical protein
MAGTESDETWSLELSGTTWRWRQFELNIRVNNGLGLQCFATYSMFKIIKLTSEKISC